MAKQTLEQERQEALAVQNGYVKTSPSFSASAGVQSKPTGGFTEVGNAIGAGIDTTAQVVDNAINAIKAIANTPRTMEETNADGTTTYYPFGKADNPYQGLEPLGQSLQKVLPTSVVSNTDRLFLYNNDTLRYNEAVRMGKVLDIDPDVIMRGDDKAFERADYLSRRVERGAVLQDIYDEFPELYKVKYGSQAEQLQAINNLQSIRATKSTFDAIQQGIWSMNDQMKLGDVGFELAHTKDPERINELTSEMERLQNNLRNYRTPDGTNPLQEVFGQTAAQAYMMGKQGGTGAIIGGAIGAVIGGLTTDGVGIGAGAATGAKWGGGADMAYEMYKMSFGNKYLELINKRDANGNKVYSNDEAYKYAMTYAAVDTGIEMASTRFMIKGVGKVAPKAVMSKVLQGATSDTIATFNRGIGTTVAQMAKASVKAGGSELVEEGLQDINEKFQHNLYRNANDPDGAYSIGDMAVGAGGAMLQALPAVIGLGAIGGGVSGIHTMKAFHEFQKLTPEEQQHAIMAEQNRNGNAIMQALKQDASSNKMAKENPELYGKIVQAQGDNVGVSTAYVNVNEMAETEQGQQAIKNMIDSGLVTQEEVSKSIEANADIPVPIGKYAQLSGGLTEETVKALEESTYFTRGGMSMKTLERAKAEVEAFNNNLVDATEKKAQRVKESIIRDEFEDASDVDREVLDQVFSNPTQVKQAYNNLYKNLVQEYRENYASDFDNMDNDIKEATASGVEPQWLTDYKSNNGGKAPRTNAERRRAAYHSSVAKAQTAFADNTEALNQSNIHHADMEHTLQQIESLERLHDKIFTLADNDISLRMQLSKSGYDVYNKVVKAIGESIDRKQRETAKANALLMAQHADVMAQYMRQMGKGGYTAMDYLRDSVRINMNAKYDNQKGYMQINPNLDLQQKLNIVDLNHLFTNASVLDKKQLKKYIKNLVNTNWNDKNNETIVNIIHSYNVNHIANGAKKPSNKERKIRNTVVHDLNNILNNAVLVETTPNTKKTQNPTTKGEKHKNNIDFYHRLYVPVSLNGNLYVIRLVVEEDKNNIGLQPKLTELYDIYIDKEGLLPPPSANGKSNGSSNPSIITVRDMLENVKQADNPDVYVKEPKDQIQTKEFKQWFGNSKVVNADGTPKVMYHGTPNGNFDTFKKGANYFTENEQYADRYQNPSASSISTGKVVDNPTTHAVYIKMEKPFDTRDSKAREIFEDEFLNQDGGYDEEGEETEHSWVSNGTELNENTGLPDWTDAEDLYHFIKDKGYDYDGIIVDEGADGGYGSAVVNRGVAYVTFEPNQVKNVKNSGEFDINNPNMYKQSVNGMTEIMSDGERIISIFKTADRSTFLHEMGHVFFDDIQKLASMDNAPKQLLDDWNALKEWSGWVDGDNVDNTKAHEKFARGWESYLRSGEAPTKGLQRVFRQFSKWLTRIYRSVQRLGGEVPSDIKDIMARMIATQDDIENYAHEQALEQFENTKLYQQLSETEQARVQGYIADIKEKAKERVMRKYMKELDNRPIKEWEDVKYDVQAAIEKRLIEEYPIYKEHQRYMALGDGALENTQYRTIEGLEKAEREEAGSTYDEAVAQEMENARNEFVNDPNAGKSNQEIAEEMLLSNQGQMELTQEEARLIKAHTNKDLAKNWELLSKLQKLDPNSENLDEELKPIEKELTKAERIKKDHARVAQELGSVSNELDTAQGRIEKLKAQLQERIDAVRAIRDGGFGTIPKYMERAKNELGDLTLSQASQYKKYQNQAVRDGKKADSALATGKVDEALQAKQSQMLNQARARVAFENSKAIKKLRTKLLDQLSRITRSQNPIMIEPNMRYFYTHMAYQMGLTKYDGLKPANGFDMMAVIKALDADADIMGDKEATVQLEPWIYEMFDAKSPRTFSTLKMSELEQLEELMTGMYKSGRTQYEGSTLIDEKGNNVTFDEAIFQIIDKAAETFGRDNGNVFNELNNRSRADALSNTLNNFNLSLLKAETFLRRLDGGKNGPAVRYIYEPINKATQKFNEYKEKSMYRLARDVKAVYSKKQLFDVRNDHLYSVGELRNVTKEQIIMLALNWGTEKNRQRALETIQSNEVEMERAFQEYMTDKDWEFVIRTWEHINSFYEERSKVQEELYGNPLKKEKGITFTIGGREIQGQYFPIVYNPKVSAKVSDFETEDIAKTMIASNAIFGTGMGATKSRLDVVKGKSLMLDFDVIPNAITEAINHVTMRKAVTDVNKLVGNSRFQEYIVDKFGMETYQFLRTWVRDNWKDEASQVSTIGRLLMTLKKRTTEAVMIGRVSVALQNALNIPVAMYRIGVGNTLKAISDAGVGFYGVGTAKYNATRDFVLSQSIFMRERVQTLDKDLKQGLSIEGKGLRIGDTNVGGYKVEQLANIRDDINQMGFRLLTETDFALSIPVWKFAYDNKVLELQSVEGVTAEFVEQEAISAGDRAVRDIFGSGDTKDSAGIQRSRDAWVQLFVPFYSYANTLYNILAEGVYGLKDQRNYGRFVRMIWGTIVIPALGMMAYKAMTNGDDDSPEDLVKSFIEELASQSIMGVPLVRDVANMTMRNILGEKSFGKTNSVIATSIIDKLQDMYTAITSKNKDATDVGRSLSQVSNRIIGFSDTITDGLWTLSKFALTDTDAKLEDVIMSIILDKKLKDKKSNKKNKH
nr:MAG TPA: crystallin beta/gamma motif-containing protein [Caudoviricetes sp.]